MDSSGFLLSSLMVVGHRGDPTRHPDNSLAGIMAGLSAVGAVEVDVRLSRDGRLVLSHDPLVDGRPVVESKWLELSQGGERLCLLDEALAVPGRLDLEVKNLPGEQGFDASGRLALMVASRARPQDIVTSFYWSDMDLVRRRAPEVTTGLLVGEKGSALDAIAHASRYRHPLVLPHHSLCGQETVRAASAAGVALGTWTVDDPVLAVELAGRGVAAIISDHPQMIHQAIAFTEEAQLTTIKEQLASELKDAMKAGDTLRRDAIRQVQTEVSTVTAQAGVGEATDEVYEVVIGAYVKKMTKARQEYLEMGERGQPMAEKLGFEVDYLSRWLPSKLGPAETAELVRQTIADLKAEGDPKAVGRVVGALMKTRDDLDGALVNQLAREELGA